MIKISKISVFCLAVMLVLTLVFPNAAADGGTDSPTTKKEGVGIDTSSRVNFPDNLPKLGIESFTDPVMATESFLLNFVINPIFFLAAGVAIILILYSSFRIVTARGEEGGLTSAKNTLIWTFVGLALIVLSYTIVRNVANILIENL